MDRAIAALDHPVFNRLQFLRAAIRTLQHVAIDQAAGAEQGRERGSYSGRQSGLRQSFKNNLPRKIIVRVFFESQDDIGQAVERDGTHHHHVRDAVHLEFEGKRDQPLDFFGGVIRPLRDDFDLRRRRDRDRRPRASAGMK